MSQKDKTLVINPGSTSTKIAVYSEGKSLFQENLSHDSDALAGYERMTDQYEFREKAIMDCLKKQNISVGDLVAVIGRGGLLKPIESGVYKVNEDMLKDLKTARYGEHASNLGALIADAAAREAGCDAYIADPVVVDELDDIARISGLAELPKVSIFHALNQKATARKAAEDIGKPYEQLNLIVVHMGGGISVGAHHNGRVIDVSQALDGDGPFSPERSGSLPVGALIRLCFSGKYTKEQLLKMNKGQGGFVSYLGTNDAREVERRFNEGDKQVALVYEALAYQVAREIGSMATVLRGKVDAIVLTGGLARDGNIVGWIKERVDFIGKIMEYPGENEMEALASAVELVLKGSVKPAEYSSEA